VGILGVTEFIERLQFFNGQRLFASDLQALEAFNREMRWLHNWSLHEVGVGSGFAVYGAKGDREVTIGPGYALDSTGREIVLTRKEVEPIPPVAGEPDGQSVYYDLTVSYPDDADLDVAETREGVCLPRGVVRLREAPVFCWVRLERTTEGGLQVKDPTLRKAIETGQKIILGRIEVLNCRLNQPVSTAQRRSARPEQRPYVACGRESQPGWASASLTGVAGHGLSGSSLPLLTLSATIDTTEAGFQTVPCYSAQIPGPREIVLTVTGGNVTLLIVDLLHVEEAKRNSFLVVALALVVPLHIDPGVDVTTIQPGALDWFIQNWQVEWLGVEG
jgi:hypothetical protein